MIARCNFIFCSLFDLTLYHCIFFVVISLTVYLVSALIYHIIPFLLKYRLILFLLLPNFWVTLQSNGQSQPKRSHIQFPLSILLFLFSSFSSTSSSSISPFSLFFSHAQNKTDLMNHTPKLVRKYHNLSRCSFYFMTFLYFIPRLGYHWQNILMFRWSFGGIPWLTDTSVFLEQVFPPFLEWGSVLIFFTFIGLCWSQWEIQ